MPHRLFVRTKTPGSMKSLMYAVIATGGKQEKVETGQVLNVELLHADAGAEVTFSPILLVDDDNVMSTTDELSGSSVTARVVGETKGEKIHCFTYKTKKNCKCPLCNNPLSKRQLEDDPKLGEITELFRSEQIIQKTEVTNVKRKRITGIKSLKRKS